MNYCMVTVNTTTAGSDIVACLLIEAGSEGVSVKDSADVAELIKSDVIWDYIDESLVRDDGCVTVSGFFDENADLSPLMKELELLKKRSEFDVGSLETVKSIVRSQDWENVWKQYYRPIEIGKIVIVPKWIKRERDEHIEVRIDPGMAFGTGSHETTAMCLKLLDGIDLREMTVADIGCGSGILGIAAVKLGAKKCVMTDIDAQAVQAARSNAELNGVTDRVQIICGELPETQKFDVVTANITADVLIGLSEKVGKYLVKGGKIILSGVINARADEVCAAYGRYKLLQRIKDGEWQAFAFENEEDIR